MGVPTSEVSYTSATTGRGDHEVNKVHVVALDKKKLLMHTCTLDVKERPVHKSSFYAIVNRLPNVRL
jgi:hypothetical protein